MITILTVNYNTSDFIQMLLNNLRAFTHHPYKVLIVDNRSKNQDYMRLQRLIPQYPNTHICQSSLQLKGSPAHGVALNQLLPRVQTPYCLIVDSDCAPIIKHWDQKLITLLEQTNSSLVGSTPPNWSPRPKDFPAPFFLFFKTKIIKNLEIDFRPQNIKLGQDTAWQLRKKFLAVNLRFQLLHIKPAPNFVRSDLIYYENQPIAAHFGRGASLGGLKYQTGKIPIISKLLRHKKGQQEKKQWIANYKKIIDKLI